MNAIPKTTPHSALASAKSISDALFDLRCAISVLTLITRNMGNMGSPFSGDTDADGLDWLARSISDQADSIGDSFEGSFMRKEADR